MSAAVPGGDVRGFYARLGVELPGWAKREASVACFANPDAHAHGDRDPSCSVNLESGAWHCWGCGAKGGALDAALARGLDSRQAFDLKVAYGLAERQSIGRRASAPRPAPRERSSAAADRRTLVDRRAVEVSERDVDGWRADLRRMRWPLRVMRAEHRAVWDRDTLLALGLGFDRGRVIFPIRDSDGHLQGVLRYAPTHERAPKMLAAAGSTLGLIPHPASDQSQDVLLVEGPPDMLAARSLGWCAFAVPGDDAWQSEWARLLAGRQVTIVMDADAAGRAAAAQIARDLASFASEVRIGDLHPGRGDGADLTDWLIAHRGRPVHELCGLLARSATVVTPPAPDAPSAHPSMPALDVVLERYEPVLGPALAGEIARDVAAVAGELHAVSDAQLQALVADGEAAWRKLDQSAAREAAALAGERDRVVAVLAGVRASIHELDSQRYDSRADVAHDSCSRDEFLLLRERSDVLARRLASINVQLATLAVRDAGPECWARAHRGAFVRGLGARQVLSSRQASTASRQGGRADAVQRSQAARPRTTDASRSLEDPSQPRARWESVLAGAPAPFSVSRPADPALPVARIAPPVTRAAPRVRR